MPRLATRSADRPDRRVVLSKAVVRCAERVRLEPRELADALALDTATIERLRRGEYLLDPADASWHRATLLVRLVRGLDSIAADDERAARSWFDSDNDHLGAAPRARIADADGLVDTVAYVDAFRARV